MTSSIAGGTCHREVNPAVASPGPDDDGSTALEAVVVIPAAMVALLFVVQMCLWAHASMLVSSAAAQGDRAAALAGATPEQGVQVARGVLGSTASGVVVSPVVEAQRVVNDQVEVSVRGLAESVLPWVELPVSARRTGAIQEFRPDR